MLKKTSIVLSSCSNLQCICTPTPSFATNPSYPGHRSHRKQQPLTRPPPCRGRAYAMVARGHSKNHHERIPWPEVTSRNSIPTPYQIFNQKKGSPYSKRRFYELVKMYHPDRHFADGSPTDGLSYLTRVERYRLVVAANNILSDPIKRGAYDSYGAGWNGQPEVLTARDAADGKSTWGSYSTKGWRDPMGCSQNATWEDWERWYKRDSKEPQRPIYFSNGAFVALVCMFAALGGVTQATRAGSRSMSILEQTDALHNEMSKELVRRRRETNAQGSREERIQNFLKQRDPFGYGICDPQEDQYRKLLPDPEVCSSASINGRSMDIYHEKNDSDGEST